MGRRREPQGHSQPPSAHPLNEFCFFCSYNPFDGPNENPEAELPLTAGKYLYVYGDMDEDGFYEGLLERGGRSAHKPRPPLLCSPVQAGPVGQARSPGTSVGWCSALTAHTPGLSGPLPGDWVGSL